MTGRIFKDPLLHFLLAGTVLYLLFASGSSTVDSDTIRVTPNSLLPYIVASDPMISVTDIPRYLQDMGAQQRDELVDEYIREEVLVREAKALGLDREDPYQRKRLISQLRYINEAFVAETRNITEADIADWYAQHKDEYQVLARTSFTQVFVAADKEEPDVAEARAKALKLELNENEVPAFRGPALGDHFLYHRNYIESEQQEIESHFGAKFADKVFSAQAIEGIWQGPWQSEHGWHLVLLKAQHPSNTPPIAKLERRIREDIIAERKFEANQIFYENARQKYRVEVDVPTGADDEA